MDPVRQCFTCLRFEHYKDSCNRFKTCINCGKAFHGPCKERARCVNCGENHNAKDKQCIVFQENAEIKRLMAEEQISGFEVSRRVREAGYGLGYEEGRQENEGTQWEDEDWREVEGNKKRKVTYAETVSQGRKNREGRKSVRSMEEEEYNRKRPIYQEEKRITRREVSGNDNTRREGV